MVKIIQLLLALLLPVLVSAQVTRTGAFIGSVRKIVVAGEWGSPTNNTDGTTAFAWYSASDYVTNSGTWVSLPDRTTNSLALTNRGASSTWPVGTVSDLNSLPTIGHPTADGGRFLRSVAFTSAQPFEVIGVMQLDPSVNNEYAILHSIQDNRLYTRFGFWSASFTSGGDFTLARYAMSNTWAIFDWTVNGSSSTLYTNRVLAGTVTVGAGPHHQVWFGSDRNANASIHYKMSEMIFYNGTLPTTIQNSNIWWYLKSKYGL